MHKNLYWLWDQVIPKEVCNGLLESIDWNKSEKGKIKDTQNEGINDPNMRITDVVWVDPFSAFGCIAQAYVKSANIEAGWNFNLSGMEYVQIGKYSNSGHYDWHNDVNNFDNEQSRKLSFSFLLNDPNEFEGGQFEMAGVQEQPNLKQGSIIVFPSFINHRVVPVTKGVRYSAVAWATGPHFK
jgi:PKHD-type hydroxylase